MTGRSDRSCRRIRRVALHKKCFLFAICCAGLFRIAGGSIVSPFLSSLLSFLNACLRVSAHSAARSSRAPSEVRCL